MKTLAIETSCDDTSVGIVAYDNNNFDVEQLLSFSQVDIHQEYGGVVPELAYRSHADKIVRLLEELGGDSIKDKIECISVTSHPGLPGALQIGVTTAHTLGSKRGKPVIEVNHIMGHVFSVLLERTMDVSRLPYVCLTVSGGHNDIYLVDEWMSAGVDETLRQAQGDTQTPRHTNTQTQKHASTQTHKHASTQAQGTRHKRQHLGINETIQVGSFSVTKIGQTIDDAAGEAFDKVARMLGGPYPGGPWIGKMAEVGEDDERVQLNASFLKADEYLFSFSGLKSQVGQLIENLQQQGHTLDGTLKANIARRFQEEVSHVLAKKLVQAAEQYGAKAVGVVGGVSANGRLRQYIDDLAVKRQLNVGKIIYPAQFVYCTDNAAMIGAAGLLDFSYQSHYERA